MVDYTFDHREIATEVKVHMLTIPNHLGQQTVMILVKRTNKLTVQDAFEAPPADFQATDYTSQLAPMAPEAIQAPRTFAPAAAPAAPNLNDIVTAMIAAMNGGINAAPPAVLVAAPAAPAQ